MGTLYVLSTPIGNLSDLSERAKYILDNIEYVIAEDTRVSKKLFKNNKNNINIISVHKFSPNSKIKQITNFLSKGDTVLLSDAGTPTISDPGYRLVSFIRDNHPKISILPVPGASACISALSVSGLPSDSFFFCGFLPKKRGKQKKLKELSLMQSSIILYESTFRINNTLNEIYSFFGNRKVFVAREMTKMFEEHIYTDLENLISSTKELKKKGEYVIVIAKKGYSN